MYEPSYIALFHSGELADRVKKLKSTLLSCHVCPRECRVNRHEARCGFCQSGNRAVVSSFCDHHGEEPVLSGKHGSGTIFFHRCNLACIYCQNYQISQATDRDSKELDGQALAEVMLYLQDALNCHNINLVSPSHFVPQIVEAVLFAVPLGLKIPLVYNTNAYDSLATLRLLDGIIDIYLPDIKYADDEFALKYSQARNYVSVSRASIKEMHGQVGDLRINAEGIAERGLIVRHLILPNNLAGSTDSLAWLVKHVSRATTVSLMSQYHPCHKALKEPLLARRINYVEYESVARCVELLGIENGWLQEMESPDHYLPDFRREGHPFQQD
jgi:putative pyruvate formate lyase activating enzyme